MNKIAMNKVCRIVLFLARPVIGACTFRFYWNVFVLITVPVAVYTGSFWGVNGVLFSLLLSRIIVFVPGWYVLLWKTIKIPFLDYCKAIIPNFNNFKILIVKNK